MMQARLKNNLQKSLSAPHLYGSLFYRRPWTRPYCDTWSAAALPLARAILADEGFEVSHVTCASPPLAPEASYKPYETSSNIPPTYHEYLLAHNDSGENVVLDGTWQQFRTRSSCAVRSVAPVLIRSCVTVPQALNQAGIAPELGFIWQPYKIHDDVAHMVAPEPPKPLPLIDYAAE